MRTGLWCYHVISYCVIVSIKKCVVVEHTMIGRCIRTHTSYYRIMMMLCGCSLTLPDRLILFQNHFENKHKEDVNIKPEQLVGGGPMQVVEGERDVQNECPGDDSVPSVVPECVLQDVLDNDELTQDVYEVDEESYTALK